MAGHRIRVVKRPRLLQVDPDAPPGHVDRGQTAPVVQPLDRPYRPVGDVEGTVPFSELDAVPHREASLFQPLNLEGTTGPGIDGGDEAAALELEP
jgi:hypothetical protein